MRNIPIPMLWASSGASAGLALALVMAMVTDHGWGPRVLVGLLVIVLGALAGVAVGWANSRRDSRTMTAVRNVDRRLTRLSDSLRVTTGSDVDEGQALGAIVAGHFESLAALEKQVARTNSRLQASDARTSLAIEAAALLHAEQVDRLRAQFDACLVKPEAREGGGGGEW